MSNSIVYQANLDGIGSAQLDGGFFAGWPNPPSAETHLKMLQNAAHLALAIDEKTGAVVGYGYAISDGVLTAYIASLEVLPAYQQQGIGQALMRQLLAAVQHLYAIDLLCDADVQPFYEKVGMQRATGMLVRNYARQSGM